MKKIILVLIIFVFFYVLAVPSVYAQSADVSKIQTFVTSIIDTLVILAGLLTAVFFVLGGFGYITSSGNPQSLEKSKKTILYSAIGLVIVLGAYVFTHIISQLATSAFGAGH